MSAQEAQAPVGSREAPASSQLTRRNFLKLGLGALTVLAAIESGGVVLLYLQASVAAGGNRGEVNVGPATAFPPGSVTEFVNDRFFLVRAADGGFLALYRRCPHLGCTISWDERSNQFACPCHASSFDIYGNFDSPPVPRPLDTFVVHIEENNVLVDTAQARQRPAFHPSQLVYA
jgi:Rieske Fe-S protein